LDEIETDRTIKGHSSQGKSALSSTLESAVLACQHSFFPPTCYNCIEKFPYFLYSFTGENAELLSYSFYSCSVRIE